MKIGVQVYSVRDDAAADFRGTMQKIRQMGYDGVELAGTYGLSAAQIKSVLAETGLEAISAHVPLVEMTEKPDETFAFYKEIGCTYVAVPYMSEELRPGTPNFPHTIELIRKACADAARYGLTMLYHNHDFEFVKGDMDDVFLAVTGAALCGAIQADAYDVRAGAGEDAHQAVFRPADLQRSLQGRGQVRQQLRQAVPEGLGNQESGPDHGDVEKQIREDPSRSARLTQWHSPPTEKQGRTALVRPIG